MALKLVQRVVIPGLPAIKTPGKSFKNDAMVQDLKQKIGSKSATTTPMTDTGVI